jgi:uncharacterized NAD-dependent epimerase/dehydratase family protein
MEGSLGLDLGKMGYGVLRYSPNPVACVVDSQFAGREQGEITGIPRPCPVVASVDDARDLGAEVLVLGIAPPGGLIPEAWYPDIDGAVRRGMSVVNGLHDPLAPRYPGLREGQWVWDVRQEPAGLSTGTGAAALLPNRRVLMIGTDMAIGKMTAGLEIYRLARERGIAAEFVATGQIGITITGRGVPLDGIRVDYASGAIEREVMAAAEADLVIVEGQGALAHPASTSTMPLLRGACPTHLVLCHRAHQTHLRRLPGIRIPKLTDYTRLYQDLAETCGTFPRPTTAAIALNTFGLREEEAEAAVQEIECQTALACADPVRHGPAKLLDAIMSRQWSNP